MKSEILKSFLFPLVVAIVAGFVGFYYFRPIADIQYSISGGITANLSQTQTTTSPEEFIFQLQVANAGTQEGRRIIVKGLLPISEYRLKKHINSDKAEVTSSNSGFEIEYPSLPPGAKFDFFFKAKSDSVSASLQVFHQDGTGKFLSPEKSSALSGSLIAYLLFFVGWLFLFGKDILEWRRNSFRDSGRYRSPSEILAEKRPWYIKKDDFPKLMEEKILRSLESQSYFQDIDNTHSYSLLNSEKPNYFTDEQWNKLVREATTGFVAAFRKKLYSTYDLQKTLRLLRFIPSKHLKEETFQELANELSTLFVKWFPTRHHSSETIAFASDRANKPECISEKDWGTLVSFAQELAFYNELNAMIDAFSSGKNISEGDWKWLTIEQQRKLKFTYEQLSQALKRISERQELANTRANINSEKLELIAAKAESNKAIERVKKQLHLIDELLSDPEAINRIEPYDDFFSTGNLAILKRLAEHLMKQA